MNFMDDLRRFGKKRAMTRLEHQWKVQDYKARQWQLAVTGLMLLLFYVFFHQVWMACLVVLIFTNASREAVRMRTLGRSHQTRRSVEVFREPIWDGDPTEITYPLRSPE